MSTYDFQTYTTIARSAAEIPEVIREGINALGLTDETDLAEIHVLLSGQHGGYDIEIIHAVEDED